MRSRCTGTPSRLGPGCSSTTTCWPPAAPRRPSATWSSGWAGEVAGLAFVVELAFLPGRLRLDGYDVFSLVRYQADGTLA